MQILQVPVKANVVLHKQASPWKDLLKAYNSLGETAFTLWAPQHENGRVLGIATGKKDFSYIPPSFLLPDPYHWGRAVLVVQLD